MRDYAVFVRRNWMLLFFGFLCVFWGNFGQSFFLGWYGEAIKHNLNISAKTYGAIYSVATLCSAAVVLWVGAWIDRWSLRRYALMVAAGLSVACVIMAYAQSVVVLAVGFFGLRLFGQALLPHTGITTMARHFDAHRGKAISLAGSGVPVGEMLLPALAVVLLAQVGWATSWWLIAVSVPLVFVPSVLGLLKGGLSTPVAHTANPTRNAASERFPLLRDSRFWFALPTLLAAPFVLTALFIHQDFLMAQKQWAPGVLAQAFVVYGVVHWAAGMLYGVLVDRYSGTHLLRWYVWPLILALLLVAWLPGDGVALLMMVLLGVTIGASGVVTNAMWAEVYGPQALGAIRSTTSSLVVFSTALSPILAGACIDAGLSLVTLFVGLAVVLIGAQGLLLLSFKPSPQPTA